MDQHDFEFKCKFQRINRSQTKEQKLLSQKEERERDSLSDSTVVSVIISSFEVCFVSDFRDKFPRFAEKEDLEHQNQKKYCGSHSQFLCPFIFLLNHSIRVFLFS